MAVLGELAVGSVVELNVNGAPAEFLVVHQGLPGTMYDASCDGTWLLTKTLDFAGEIPFDTTDNDYENSDIHAYLNDTVWNWFDDNVKNAILQVKIPYTAGNGTNPSLKTGADGLSTRIFLPAHAEIGFAASSYHYTEGAAWTYFDGSANADRVATLDGEGQDWWLRSVRKSGTSKDVRLGVVKYNGAYGYKPCTSKGGVRFAFVLPGGFDPSATETAAVSGCVSINGVMRTLTGKGYVNVGGVLRDLSDAQVNIGGVLKSLKG